MHYPLSNTNPSLSFLSSSVGYKAKTSWAEPGALSSPCWCRCVRMGNAMQSIPAHPSHWNDWNFQEWLEISSLLWNCSSQAWPEHPGSCQAPVEVWCWSDALLLQAELTHSQIQLESAIPAQGFFWGQVWLGAAKKKNEIYLLNQHFSSEFLNFPGEQGATCSSHPEPNVLVWKKA